MNYCVGNTRWSLACGFLMTTFALLGCGKPAVNSPAPADHAATRYTPADPTVAPPLDKGVRIDLFPNPAAPGDEGVKVRTNDNGSADVQVDGQAIRERLRERVNGVPPVTP